MPTVVGRAFIFWGEVFLLSFVAIAAFGLLTGGAAWQRLTLDDHAKEIGLASLARPSFRYDHRHDL